MSFPDRLKEARTEKKISQKALAEQIGISPSTYNGYERGYTEPSVDYLRSLAQALSVSVDYLLEIENDNKIAVTDDERQLIEEYRLLDDDGKSMVKEVFVFQKNWTNYRIGAINKWMALISQQHEDERKREREKLIKKSMEELEKPEEAVKEKGRKEV